MFGGLMASGLSAVEVPEEAADVLEHYCFGCHDSATRKGGLDMEELLGGEEVDGTLIFENLLTGKMPPAEKDQPDPEEKQAVLNWLGKSQEDASLKSFRRISRH